MFEMMARFNNYDELSADACVSDTRACLAACPGLVLVSQAASLSAPHAVAPTPYHEKIKSFDIYNLPREQRVDGLRLVAIRVLQGFDARVPAEAHLHELRHGL